MAVRMPSHEAQRDPPWQELGLLCANLCRQDPGLGNTPPQKGPGVEEESHTHPPFRLSGTRKDAQLEIPFEKHPRQSGGFHGKSPSAWGFQGVISRS